MDENNIYFAADLHLFHKNILQIENRPFNYLDEMHEYIIKNWNKKISKVDKTLILGDLTFGNQKDSLKVIEQLNGRKYLIKGNHDKKPNQWYRDIGIHSVSEFPILLNNYFICSHEPMLYIKYPFVNIHGHVHNSPNFLTFTKSSICVSIDRWNLEPVSMFCLIKNYRQFLKYIENSANTYNIMHENNRRNI